MSLPHIYSCSRSISSGDRSSSCQAGWEARQSTEWHMPMRFARQRKLLRVGAQVFEQLFQAYEQRLPQELEDKAERQGWLDPRDVPAESCPAERHLQIAFNQTPQVGRNAGRLLLAASGGRQIGHTHAAAGIGCPLC